jgi:hypothetical protein
VDPNTPGTYTVSYSASDNDGNAATNTRTVVVQDTTAPTIACSSNITVFTTNASGAAVTFTTTATDLCSGTATIVCNPASGSVFPLGTNTVQCTATDAGGNPATCSFTVTVLLNQAPVAGNVALGTLQNHACSVLITKLLHDDTDADGDPLTITAVSSTSTNGGTVTLSSTNVVYTPATNFAGADLFTYTVSDSRGAVGTGSVLVQVLATSSSPNLIGGISITQAGTQMSFALIPGMSYTVERSTDGITWTPLQTVTGPANGILVFLDSSSQSGTVYYRTTGS